MNFDVGQFFGHSLVWIWPLGCVGWRGANVAFAGLAYRLALKLAW